MEENFFFGFQKNGVNGETLPPPPFLRKIFLADFRGIPFPFTEKIRQTGFELFPKVTQVKIIKMPHILMKFHIVRKSILPTDNEIAY